MGERQHVQRSWRKGEHETCRELQWREKGLWGEGDKIQGRRDKRKCWHTQDTPKQSSQQVELLELSFFPLSKRDNLKPSPVGQKRQNTIAFIHRHSITCHRASIQEAGAESFRIHVLYDARKTFLSPLLLSSHQLHGTHSHRLQNVQKMHCSRGISAWQSMSHVADTVNGISVFYSIHL